MVFIHYNNTQAYLPTPEQILLGIMKAQINQFSSEEYSNVVYFDDIIKSNCQIWKRIFSLSSKSVKINQPLTLKILGNPKNEFVKTIIYIYSMESFVFKEMNKASRNKDTSQIEFYGPFASALSFIIHSGNKK